MKARHDEKRVGRRTFLRGSSIAAAGLAFGLPTLASRFGAAQTQPRLVIVRQANGVVQLREQVDGVLTDVEDFWPSDLGALTRAGLAAEPSQTISALAEYAERLTLVRGTCYAHTGRGCSHAIGNAQLLTGLSPLGAGGLLVGAGESIDSMIARAVQPPGTEPLTLLAGVDRGSMGQLSYTGPMAFRSPERNPFNAYMRLIGSPSLDPELAAQIARGRRSVNDLVRTELQELKGSAQLGVADRQKLADHLNVVRDIERTMACQLTDSDVRVLETLQEASEDNDLRVEVTKMHMNLIALAFECDIARVATLQIGTGADATEYTIDGARLPPFHQISHRVYADADSSAPAIEGAVEKHRQIDRLHMEMFRHLLQRIDLTAVASDTVAWMTSDVGTGGHSMCNIPQVVVGDGGGFLRAGQYIDAGHVPHKQLLNVMLNVMGLRKDDGSLIDDFASEPDIADGLIDGMLT